MIKNKILLIIISISITTFFTGCYKNNTLVKLNKENSFKKSILLYGQKITVPENLISKVFPDISMKVKYRGSSELIGKKVDDEFIFNNNRSPYYILKLDKPLNIEELTIYNTATYTPILKKSNKPDLIGLLIGSLPDTPKFPSLVHIGTKEQDKLIPFETKFENINNALEAKKETIVFNKPFYTDTLHVNISRLNISLGHSYKSQIFKNYKFLIKGYNPDYETELIESVLKNRKKKDKNEILIRNIAQDNIKLYRTLQYNTDLYNIPKYSILTLPEDVNIQYAITNTFEIYRTGRYKNISGEFKKFKIEEVSFMQSSGDYQYGHEVEINGEKIKNKVSMKSNKKDTDINFIDFSNGI